jgi:hypothetical protein
MGTGMIVLMVVMMAAMLGGVVLAAVASRGARLRKAIGRVTPHRRSHPSGPGA